MTNYRFIHVRTKDKDDFRFDFETYNFNYNNDKGRLVVTNQEDMANVLVVPLNNVSFVRLE